MHSHRQATRATAQTCPTPPAPAGTLPCVQGQLQGVVRPPGPEGLLAAALGAGSEHGQVQGDKHCREDWLEVRQGQLQRGGGGFQNITRVR